MGGMIENVSFGPNRQLISSCCAELQIVQSGLRKPRGSNCSVYLRRLKSRVLYISQSVHQLTPQSLQASGM